ncbi:MAG: SRPBCC family protein [Calditrichaeota bacterium]|nr:SRPBCC family protein [Calditrichota bacterium]
MKVLKWIVTVIIALLVIFLLIGVFVPQFSYRSKITVNKPVEHAFAVFTNPDLMSNWMLGLQSIETVEGEPETVGSKFKFSFVQNGEHIEIVETITEFVKNHKYSIDIDAEPMIAHTEISFNAIDSNQTEIIADTEVNGKNMLWRSVLALSQSYFQENSDIQYQQLADLIESTPVVKETADTESE